MLGSMRTAASVQVALAVAASLVVPLASRPAAAQPSAAQAPGPASPPTPEAVAELPKPPDAPPFDADTVLVRFRSGSSRARQEDVLARHGLARGGETARTGFVEARRRRSGPAVPAIVEALAAEADVEEAEPNHTRVVAATPNDTYYGKGRQRYLETTRFPAAWDMTTGSNSVTVAVVDTGVALRHPDLAGRLKPGWDFVGNDSSADDDHGHGTMVAGVLGAAGNNTRGIAGAAWNVSILPVKVLDHRGVGTDADVAEGITWAADQGAAVINLSLGGPADSAVLRQAVSYAVGKGAVVVAAAGNLDAGVPTPDETAAADTASVRRFYPAALSGILAVTATDVSGNFAWFSNFGGWADIAAPGIDIWTTVKGSGTASQGSYFTASGTSMATPLVAGAAALLRAKNPTWTGAQVTARLRATARDAGPPGLDPYYGVGLLDAGAALGATPLPPVHPAADGNGSPDRATHLTGPATDAISPEGDEDWFSFDVPGPGMVFVGVDQETAPAWAHSRAGWAQERAELMDPVVELFGPDRRRLAEQNSYSATTQEYVGINVVAGGRHYARVTSAFGARSIGDYTLEYQYEPIHRQFDMAQGYEVRAHARGVAVGDVTGDGRPDVLMTSSTWDDLSAGNELLVFATRRDGWPRTPVRYPVGPGAELGLDTGDLDGDGKADVVVGTDAGLAVLYQRSGVLAAPVRVSSASKPRQVWVRDMNNDGRRDIVVAGETTVVMRNTGTGWTSMPVDSRRAYTVEVGDVTGDRLLDVVVGVGGTLSVLRQATDGRFARADYQAGDESWDPVSGIAVGDFGRDGRTDVLVAAGSEPFLRSQTTIGTLGPAVRVPGFRTPNDVAAADVDRDGSVDLVVEGTGFYNEVDYVRNESGTLTYKATFDLFGAVLGRLTPTGVAVADVTGDGRPEIVAGNLLAGLSVLRQRTTTWPRSLPPFVRDWSVADGAAQVPATTPLSVRFSRALDPATVTTSNVRLLAATGTVLSAPVTYDSSAGTVSIRPDVAPAANAAYRLVLTTGLRDSTGERMPYEQSLRFRTAGPADTTPPDTTILTGPAGVVDHFRPYSFAVSASEPGTRYECRSTSQDFLPCAPPWRPLSDYVSDFTFEVRAVDAAGNVDPTPAVRTWSIRDLDAPPNDFYSGATALEGASGGVTTTTAGATAHFADPRNGGNVTEANVWFLWRAPTSATTWFTTAGTKLDTTLGVYRWSADGKQLLPVADNDDDGAALTSTATFAAVAGTEYVVQVASFFDEYAMSEGDVVLRWFVPGSDTTPPDTTITGGPSSVTTARTATLSFAANEAGSVFECSLDGALFAPCSSPSIYSALGTGTHSFAVRARDPSGNVDPTPATRSWRIPSYDEVIRADAPRAWWRLGDPVGSGTARDATGAGYAAAVRSVGLGTSGAVAGDVDTAAWFGQAESAVDAGDRDGLDFGSADFTVEAWVRTSTPTSVVAGKYDGSRRSWRLMVGRSTPGRVSLVLDDGSGLREFHGPAATVTDDAWHHVAAVVDRDWGVRVYVDGVEQATAGTTTGSVSNRAPFQVGHSYLSGEYLGYVDEVAVYPTALSATRVRTHWGSGRGVQP